MYKTIRHNYNDNSLKNWLKEDNHNFKFNKPLYKYLKKEHADQFFDSGKIQIAPISTYKDIEKYGTEIGDEKEGLKIRNLDENYNNKIDGEKRPAFAERFIKISPETSKSGTIIINASYEEIAVSPNHLILCLTEDCSYKAMKEFGYDTCIKINNPLKFIENLSMKNKYLQSYIGTAPCVYDARLKSNTLSDSTPPELLKEPKYSYQKEIRSAWNAKADKLKPFLAEFTVFKEFYEVVNF